ncbi:MAG: amino acid permease [Enterocloster asparagiformis]|nr:amino acid permease [Enterocloster asparagiformis]
MSSKKGKLGLLSIILLGINAVIGSGIFLMPGQAYALMGTNSLWVYIFDALLVIAMVMCYAEVGGMFTQTGGAYIYAREAFGEFVGFEVGIMRWVMCTVSWATMAVGFTTALANIMPSAADPAVRNIIVVSLIVGLGIVNIIGIDCTKYLNNIITTGKLIPLIVFVGVGVFFIKGGNFTAPSGVETGVSNFSQAAMLIFYAFTGFESIAVAAGDMANPKKDVPIASFAVMLLVSAIYLLVQAVSIGTMGPALATSTAPIAEASGQFLGSLGGVLVTVGTLVSIGGINLTAAFITPRNVYALAEDGLVPRVLAKTGKRNTPYIAIIISVLITIPVALSGTFTQLAVLSVVARFILQYIPTCLSVLVLRKREDLKSTYTAPFGWAMPVISVVVSIWLLMKSSPKQLIWGMIALAVIAPLYFVMKRVRENESGAKS